MEIDRYPNKQWEEWDDEDEEEYHREMERDRLRDYTPVEYLVDRFVNEGRGI